MAGGGSLNDYEALTASLGGQDVEDADFDTAEDEKRKAGLQVAMRVLNKQLTISEAAEIINMLGLRPGDDCGPSLAPGVAFNPSTTLDPKGN
jgi:hypothetical protein